MANRVITIVEPSDTTPGLTVSMTRTAAGTTVQVTYDANDGTRPPSTYYDEAAVAGAPGGLRNAINTLFTAALSASKPRMGF